MQQFLFFNSNHLIAQEATDLEKQINSGSSSVISNKKQIPNYQHVNRAVSKGLPGDSVQSVRVSSHIGKGGVLTLNESLNLKEEYQFIEDPLNPGYPIGWISNSKESTYQEGDGYRFLELPDSEFNVYLGKSYAIAGDSIFKIFISYESAINTTLIINQFDNMNSEVGKEQSLILSAGNESNYQINLNSSHQVQFVMIKVHKSAKGTFKLISIIIEQNKVNLMTD